MAVNMRYFVTVPNCRISKQLSAYCFRKFSTKHYDAWREIFYCRKALQYVENLSSTSLKITKLSRFLHVNVGSCTTSAHVTTKGLDDPEFVKEELTFKTRKGDIVEDMNEKMKNVQEKTGVIIKTTNFETEWKIIIGGTHQMVRHAVLHVKSLVTNDPQNKRLIAQDEQFEKQDVQKGVRKNSPIHQNSLFQETPIWKYYRRNFKGQKPPMKTRKKCIRGKGESQKISGNPCPICRLYLANEYQLDYKDIDLLTQFICPHTGEIFDASKTGVCQYQQKNLTEAIQKAKNYGYLFYTIPGPRSVKTSVKRAELPINVRLK